jgi:hypothetical protein
MGAGIVEQQERADVLAQAVIGKQRANRKAVTDPVLLGAAVKTKNLFHEIPPLCMEKAYECNTYRGRPVKLASAFYKENTGG